MDGYGNLIAARLRKLAAAHSTGMLPFTGHTDGAIYFKDGKVVLAESRRTPRPPRSAAPAADPAGDTGSGRFGRLTALLAHVEPTVDAALELLSSESRYAKFRATRVPAAAGGLALEGLLAEVRRRQQVLRQLSAVITADMTVARNPQLNSGGVQVSASQWALLIRVREGSTPRALAWELGHSVFSTTTEVYRLMALRLLSSASSEKASPDVMSFVRAVTDEKGDGMPEDVDG